MFPAPALTVIVTLFDVAFNGCNVIFLFVASTLHVTALVSLLAQLTVPSPSYVYVRVESVPYVIVGVVPNVIVAFFFPTVTVAVLLSAAL